MRILLTGGTGFIGGHLLEFLTEKGFDVMATCRNSSQIGDRAKLCQWINVQERDWMIRAEEFKPEVIIHTAWTGVRAAERNDWNKQIENIAFQQQLLELKPRKIIALGSQAEYGTFEAVVDEIFPANPITAYGAVKLASLDILRSYCALNGIDWIWFRLFSAFGPGEGADWLIPSAVRQMRQGESMDCTTGEQRCAYLYVGEIVRAIAEAVVRQANSGVYNLSSRRMISIRELLETIRDYVDPSFKLNFGTLPYRPGQSMFMGGDNSKLGAEIYRINDADFDEQLKKTVESYL